MRSSSYSPSANEAIGGRVAILLLLFALAIFSFIRSGFSAFATICMVPVFIGIICLTFRYRMFLFWTLCCINFVLQMKSFTYLPSGVPMSLYNEALSILLLALAIIDVKETRFERAANFMLFALIIWCSFCTLEVLNNTWGLGIDIGSWYTGARLMAFQLMYAFLVFTIYINTPKILIKYLFLWGGFIVFAAFWIWKQQKIGFTDVENQWIQTRGRSTHILQAGTLIRYFSVFSDAASAGIHFASAAVAFIIFGITSKIKKFRCLFLGIGIASAWAMFPTGTRTAIFCMLAGFLAYTVLSKSVKLTAIIGTAGFLFFLMLAFTNIGNGNSQIRRMRSAFDRGDASANVRTYNQSVIKKYLADAPFGLGIGISSDNVPANNKYRKLSMIPPDSEYVFIWVHTGVVGIIIFLLTTIMMFCGASYVVMFRLRSPSLRGIGAGLCCAFVSMQLGGYGNQVLMQFPNYLVFYGGLSIVYVLPFFEKEWLEFEEEKLAQQAERARIKAEKKKAKRV